MSIDRRATLIFFDSSCLIAAAGSPSGGSGFLLSVCAKGYLQAAISQYVQVEAERNIRARMKPEALTAYHLLLTAVPFVVAPLPSPLPSLPGINPKDLHVVAAAAAVPTAYLLTLDKGLLAEVNLAHLSFPALTPGDFIKTVLPSHSDYPAMR